MNDLSFTPANDPLPVMVPRLFENSHVAHWEMDVSDVEDFFETLRARGVDDLRRHFTAYPEALREANRRLRIAAVNEFAVKLFEAGSEDDLLGSFQPLMLPETWDAAIDYLVALWEKRPAFECEIRLATLRGGARDLFCTVTPAASDGISAVSFIDISRRKEQERALQRQNRRLRALNRVSDAIASNLDLRGVIQAVTDAATDHCSAKFGAFFHNAAGTNGGHYPLYVLSGGSKADIADFPPLREKAIFNDAFRDGIAMRADDVRHDAPDDLKPVADDLRDSRFQLVSCMAVPVRSRSGELYGALLLGHDSPGAFDEEAEEIVTSMATRTAMAIENAKLFESAQRGKAIIDSSQDAIISKDLNGIITSWNTSATRMFGYRADEMIGQSILTLIPEDRHAEETEILHNIRNGRPVTHFETIRRRKDGSMIEISLSVSPVRDPNGKIVGASKIARDITAQRRAAEQQTLLLREMNHRIKNLFALAGGVVALSARSAESAEELANVVQSRLIALARAHELTLPPAGDVHAEQSTTLHALIDVILSPYVGHGTDARQRFEVKGDNVELGGAAVTSFALLLHEFATNAAKYGALTSDHGWIEIRCTAGRDQTLLVWQEHGGPAVSEPESEGFGSLLGRATVKGQLAGDIVREWTPDGLLIRLTADTRRLKEK